MRKPCRFIFDDPEAVFDGFDLGSTWNGFDNVAVTPEVLRQIVAYFRENCAEASREDTEQGNLDMLAIEPMEDGLISLSHGYATQIVEEG